MLSGQSEQSLFFAYLSQVDEATPRMSPECPFRGGMVNPITANRGRSLPSSSLLGLETGLLSRVIGTIVRKKIK